MSYDQIDPILSSWAQARRILILREDLKKSRRYFYISSPSAETFQIVIEPEKNKIVRIDVHLIEAKFDEEIHKIYKFGIDQLRSTLDLIVREIDCWFNR